MRRSSQALRARDEQMRRLPAATAGAGRGKAGVAFCDDGGASDALCGEGVELQRDLATTRGPVIGAGSHRGACAADQPDIASSA